MTIALSCGSINAAFRGHPMQPARIVLALVVLLLGFSSESAARNSPLTFEERVRAQEAIERVYYAHQIGTKLTFEEAVPR